MMETFWYCAVTLMLTVYVVLDGFDLGLGIIYPLAARAEPDRCAALASIRPVWNGSEVWLIAAGGLLFFAFPKAYAAGFSGFYLALIMVLWLLIARGLALELRTHVDHVLWRQFWDLSFVVASVLLTLVLGAALGNLIRGVPLNEEGYFFVALWTDFMTGPDPGILDWFTVFMGVTSVAILAFHGASYLAMKTEGLLRERARRVAWLAGLALVVLIGLATTAVTYVQPSFRHNYAAHPIGYVFLLLGMASLVAALELRRRDWDLSACCATSLLIVSMTASTAWGAYPNILIATNDPAHSLTVFNATAGAYGMQLGLWWFLFGFGLIIVYQIISHRAFAGKVRL
jgi:cytochrome d ubiquinol oxidase subunit II